MNPHRKITPGDAEVILASPLPRSELAAQFKVHVDTIAIIQRGEHWTSSEATTPSKTLADGRRRDRKGEVAAWIAKQLEPVTVEEVREAFGLTLSNSAQVVCRLVKDGAIRRVRAATYAASALREEVTR